MAVSNSLDERYTERPEWALAQRIVASPELKSSRKLCRFFLYVVDCSLRGAPEEATEQQIGIHVFDRPPGYNSSDDSIVRSQARLLRIKLAAYFARVGDQEDLILDIPRGHYLPVFRSAAPVPEPQPLEEERQPEEPLSSDSRNLNEVAAPIVSPPRSRNRPLTWTAIACACMALGILMGFAWARNPHLEHNSSTNLFWKPFLQGAPPLVIYSNPLFTGTPYTGMRLVTSSVQRSLNDVDDDTYTGTGEASAIRDLTHVFDAHHAEFILKRSRLVTWDEAKSHNLIFIGASSQNSALRDLKTNFDFAIDIDNDHQGFIANRHPLQGEPASFKPSSANEEYAIIASVPGLEPGTRIAIFTGLTTNGTQAAVEFVCNPDNAQQLAKVVRKPGDALVPFEAVLHIKMSGGVPLQAEVVAIHPHG
jgi:hypothetical protein